MQEQLVNFTIGDLRSDWTREEIKTLYELPFNDLLFYANSVHRKNFDPNQVQISTLLSIKTGSCPEDCKYCPQSAHYNTGLAKEPFMDSEEILKHARCAKESGASRFCMGAAWRNLNDRDLEKVADIVKQVKEEGLETCLTLGMISNEQAKRLKNAGLDYYNHNVDSSPEFYKKIITTRTYEDRLETIENVTNNDINVCSGGIIGMGETREDRAGMLETLANLKKQPKSVPINMLEKVKGTPLEAEKELDIFEFVRTIAVARIMMPKSYVRLSAGRQNLSEEAQSLCFFAGANSIFYGEKLLTQKNPETEQDQKLLKKLGISPV